jgi:hypothetical protein
MRDWKKLDAELEAHGIVQVPGGSSIGTSFHTLWNEADAARSIISQVIADGKLIMKLDLRPNQRVSTKIGANVQPSPSGDVQKATP